MTRNSTRAAALAVALLLIGALAAWAWPGPGTPKPPLGMFTSLPIVWAESASVDEAIDADVKPHWVRAQLEDDHRLVALDTLDTGGLAKIDALVMAQPRPLAPAENVALDEWVRKGGRLLLFADPFLTERSLFPLGDKRRPQAIVLLSPILARWGLELTFDDSQPEVERTVTYRGVALPEQLAGRLRVIPGGEGARCVLAADGLVADCRIGAGHALVVADSALLDADRPADEGAAALSKLVERAFAKQ
jgi:hypothetical protein